MKKLLSLMLCLALLLSLATTTSATESTTTVSLEVPDETYTLSIPATVTIDAASKTGSVTVAVEEANLIWSTALKICMEATNAVDGESGSYLVNAESGKKIHYKISSDYDGANHVGGSEYVALYYMPSGSDDSNTITLTVDGAYPGAGTYSDILTFTVTAQ